MRQGEGKAAPVTPTVPPCMCLELLQHHNTLNTLHHSWLSTVNARRLSLVMLLDNVILKMKITKQAPLWAGTTPHC